MISPGELDRGVWVIPEVDKKEKDFSAEENPFEEIAAIINMEPIVPHLVLAVELPYIVVADCISSQTGAITKIWKSNEKKLQEVSKDFVMTFDPTGFARGEALVRKATEAKKLNKSSEEA
jgi:hypothetical protein